MIQSISIFSGHGRNGRSESFGRIDLQMGQVVSIVGPTGSGKTTLIGDIELFADGDTPSGRRILIDGKPAPSEFRYNPACNPIALITQHTTFLSDLPVREFLLTHSRVRTGGGEDPVLVQQAIDFANKLTGEPIDMDNRMTELSGGQTRALLIADATVICSTPVVLLDEVENAGIHRTRAVQLLREYRKIFIFVTHDPRIALLVRFPHRDAGRPGDAGAHHQRRRARRVVARQSAGRRAFGLAREAADGRSGSECRRNSTANCGRWHESRNCCRAGHDRQDFGDPSLHAKTAASRAQDGVPEARRAVRRRGRGARQGVRHSHAEGLFRRALPRPLQRDGAGRRASLGRAERLRHAAGRDGGPVPAMFALRRRRAGAGGARSHQRHEPAAEGRADALAGRRGGGHEDRPHFAGRARGVSRTGFRTSPRRSASAR